MNTKIKTFYIISGLLIVSLVSVYIFQVSSLVESNYFIKNYQEKITDYSQKSNNMEYKFLQDNSLLAVEEVAEELKFKEVNKTSYVEVSGSEVVVR